MNQFFSCIPCIPRLNHSRARQLVLEIPANRGQIVCMKTVTYPLRLDKGTIQRVQLEAKRRRKSMADVFREAIGLGLPALPPIPDAGMDGLVADTWEKLGPAPEIDYDKLQTR